MSSSGARSRESSASSARPLARIRREDPEVLDGIREHRSIISFRNILVHNYDGLDHRIVWGVVQEDLENLLEDLQVALSSSSSHDRGA